MLEDMPKIDLSGIESLRQVKGECHTLQERLDMMEAKKDKVSAAVYQKVKGDYSNRLEAMKAEAEPLKNQVRAEYAKLRQLMESLTKAGEKAQFEKEELEFRHELGEMVGKEFEKAHQAAVQTCTERQAELDEADQLRAKFLEVFDSEADLEQPPQEPALLPLQQAELPAPETLPEPASVEPMAQFEEARPVEVPPPPVPPKTAPLSKGWDLPPDYEPEQTIPVSNVAPPAQAAPPPLEEDDIDAVDSLEELSQDSMDPLVADFVADLDEEMQTEAPTVETMRPDFADAVSEMPMQPVKPMGPPMTPGFPPFPPPVPEAATMKLDKSHFQWDAPAEEAEGTMIISNPKITVLNEGKPGQVYALGMGTTSVGRSPDNDIHIPEERVSRKHAQVAFGPGGYAIYDLNSENGTYVNGNRIREHFLMDGDQILIGTTQFLYSEK